MPPTADVFWSESLPPQLSLGKDAGCCRGLLVIDMVTRPLQCIDIAKLLLQLSSETDTDLASIRSMWKTPVFRHHRGQFLEKAPRHFWRISAEMPSACSWYVCLCVPGGRFVSSGLDSGPGRGVVADSADTYRQLPMPSSRSRANQRYTVPQGGKLSGIRRHAMPPRST
jgi:hypothetical protein